MAWNWLQINYKYENVGNLFANMMREKPSLKCGIPNNTAIPGEEAAKHEERGVKKKLQ